MWLFGKRSAEPGSPIDKRSPEPIWPLFLGKRSPEPIWPLFLGKRSPEPIWPLLLGKRSPEPFLLFGKRSG